MWAPDAGDLPQVAGHAMTSTAAVLDNSEAMAVLGAAWCWTAPLQSVYVQQVAGFTTSLMACRAGGAGGICQLTVRPGVTSLT
jgi:hypothetical protein